MPNGFLILARDMERLRRCFSAPGLPPSPIVESWRDVDGEGVGEAPAVYPSAPSPAVEGESPRTKEQERWWNYGYLKGFFDCNKSLAVSDASPAGTALAEAILNLKPRSKPRPATGADWRGGFRDGFEMALDQASDLAASTPAEVNK